MNPVDPTKLIVCQKVAILLIGIGLGCICFRPCQAQSVVGIWKRTATTWFTTDKATGKQMPVPAQVQKQYDQRASTYQETLEFKPNHTYITTVSTSTVSKPRVHQGTYSQSGADLNMNIPLVSNQKTTITIKSITGKTMIWDMVFMGKLTKLTYLKVP